MTANSNSAIAPVSHAFQSTTIRIYPRGEHSFEVAAKDVCEALEIQWYGSKSIAHVPDEWKGVGSDPTPGGEQKILTLTEEGLYFFLGRSDKQKALPFQKWVYGEVLPAIRKTGSYSQNNHPNILSKRFFVVVKPDGRMIWESIPLDAMVVDSSIKMSRLVAEYAKPEEFGDIMNVIMRRSGELIAYGKQIAKAPINNRQVILDYIKKKNEPVTVRTISRHNTKISLDEVKAIVGELVEEKKIESHVLTNRRAGPTSIAYTLTK